MEFRPCIDIHNGQVKQIIGGSLKDEKNAASENYTAEQDASYYALLYKRLGIKGGHIIMLNAVSSEYYSVTREQALGALMAYPKGMQIGGGITAENAGEYLAAGAAQIIVTSYVFRDGRIDYDNLNLLKNAVGAEHIVLDLSCRKTAKGYVIVTDRWQKQTNEVVTYALLNTLAESCGEFLIHAVDVEGKAEGIEEDLVRFLGEWGRKPITYAGGVHDFADLRKLKELGKDKLHVTIGSALDIFGGKMKLEEVLAFMTDKL